MLKLILIAGCIAASMGQLMQRSFNFVNTLSSKQNNFWVWRSEATDLKTLRLEDGNQRYTVQFSICALPLDPSLPVTVSVDDIRYSNDGPSDDVFLKMDTVQVGVFQTIEKWRSGHEWNVFRNSGKVGRNLQLSAGAHTLQIKVATDQWGVEFDTIRMNAENQNPEQELFCGSSLIE